MSSQPGSDKLHKELFDLGIQNRRDVVGNVYVEAALRNGSSEFAYPGQQLVTEYWHAHRLKSWPEFGIHVRGAINNGLSEIEICESILHATIYCGVPAGVEAMKVAEKTIKEMVANGEHKQQLAEVSPEARQ